MSIEQFVLIIMFFLSFLELSFLSSTKIFEIFFPKQNTPFFRKSSFFLYNDFELLKCFCGSCEEETFFFSLLTFLFFFSFFSLFSLFSFCSLLCFNIIGLSSIDFKKVSNFCDFLWAGFLLVVCIKSNFFVCSNFFPLDFFSGGLVL